MRSVNPSLSARVSRDRWQVAAPRCIYISDSAPAWKHFKFPWPWTTWSQKKKRKRGVNSWITLWFSFFIHLKVCTFGTFHLRRQVKSRAERNSPFTRWLPLHHQKEKHLLRLINWFLAEENGERKHTMFWFWVFPGYAWRKLEEALIPHSSNCRDRITKDRLYKWPNNDFFKQCRWSRFPLCIIGSTWLRVFVMCSWFYL